MTPEERALLVATAQALADLYRERAGELRAKSRPLSARGHEEVANDLEAKAEQVRKS